MRGWQSGQRADQSLPFFRLFGVQRKCLNVALEENSGQLAVNQNEFARARSSFPMVGKYVRGDPPQIGQGRPDHCSISTFEETQTYLLHQVICVRSTPQAAPNEPADLFRVTYDDASPNIYLA